MKKYCKTCTEYSCGAQGSDNISDICGDSGVYFYHPKEFKIETEKEDKRTMQIDLILNNILDEIGELRDILMSDKFPASVMIQRKNTAYGLDYASCIIMKYKKVFGEKKED